MKRQFLYIAIILTSVLSFCQCSGRDGDNTDGYGKEYPRTKEATSIIDSCISLMHSDPAQLHHIIDSVGNAKLISPQRCDYYHAMVVFEGEGKCDSALAICNRLLDNDKFGDDKFLEEELCVLASNITFSLNRFLKTLEYANRGIAICHGQALMNYDEATLMGRVGRVEQILGRTEDARQTYAKANELLEEDKTFGGLIARISLMMKQASLYSSIKEYDKTIAVCHEVLNLAKAFHLAPSAFENRPKQMTTSGDATQGFLDFYESQMFCKIAQAYRNKIELDSSIDATANRDSMNLYLDRWEQTQSHNSPVNLSNAMQLLYFAGRTEEFNQAKETVAALYKGDSIAADYVDYLHLLAQDAASRQDYLSSNSYLQRALAISDSIRHKETTRTLTEQMSINMTQQLLLARKDAEHKASRNKQIIAIVIIILALGTVIAILRRRNKEKEEMLQMTQQDLIETQEEVNDIIQQLEESKQDKSAKAMRELYDRIEQVTKEKGLYLNPDFNMIMLAEELGTNRAFISACINNITGKPFRTWLAEHRLNHFIELQRQNPLESIEVLIMRCGYKEQSTFHRQFKATFGTTPLKYNFKSKQINQNEEKSF